MLPGTRIKFNTERDIALITECIRLGVIDSRNGKGWKVVAPTLAETDLFPNHLTPRACRDRMNHLIVHFKRRNMHGRPGITSAWRDNTEKDSLLKELLEIKKEPDFDTSSDIPLQMHVSTEIEESSIDHEQLMDEALSPERDFDTQVLLPDKTEAYRKEITSCFSPADQGLLYFVEQMEKNRKEERAAELALRREEMEKMYALRNAELDMRRKELLEQAEERKAWLEIIRSLVSSVNGGTSGRDGKSS